MSVNEAKDKMKSWIIESIKSIISPKNAFHLVVYAFLFIKMSYNGGSIVYHTLTGFIQEVRENKQSINDLSKEFSASKVQLFEDSIKQAQIDKRQNERIDKKQDRLIAKQP